LPFLRITLKCLKPKALSTEPRSLGEHIRRRRPELGLTQPHAGERLGVSGWTVANWEKRHTKPDIHARQAVAAFLGLDPGNPDG
jgi:DNA-binding transcriptional regulator YiaG